MSEIQPTQEHEKSTFEVNEGDVLFVSRNLKDKEGHPLLDAEGKRMTALEDGWEVVSLKAINPSNGREGIMLRNTDNKNELKFYSASQLQSFQEQAEANIMSRASSVASEMLGGIDQHSAEIAEEEPRVTEGQAEKIGEEVLEAAEVDVPLEADAGGAEAPEAIDEFAEEQGLQGEFNLQSAKGRYEHEVDAYSADLSKSLAITINAFEGEGQYVALGRRTIIDTINLSVADLDSALLHYDDYPTAAMRTYLERTVRGLQDAMGAAGRYSESTINDALKALEVSERALSDDEGRATELDTEFTDLLERQGINEPEVGVRSATNVLEDVKGEVHSIDMLKQDLEKASDIVGRVRGSEFGVYVTALENVIQESYSRQIDVSEISNVVQGIKMYAGEGGELATAIDTAGKSLQRVTEELKAAWSKVS